MIGVFRLCMSWIAFPELTALRPAEDNNLRWPRTIWWTAWQTRIAQWRAGAALACFAATTCGVLTSSTQVLILTTAPERPDATACSSDLALLADRRRASVLGLPLARCVGPSDFISSSWSSWTWVVPTQIRIWNGFPSFTVTSTNFNTKWGGSSSWSNKNNELFSRLVGSEYERLLKLCVCFWCVEVTVNKRRVGAR
jgi:hypothetical protein